ncbi:Ectopic P granules protein 5 [Mortierella sp. GBA30]|nr:Ectopic P granules protein 5 [Mortierella sp. GBA30]
MASEETPRLYPHIPPPPPLSARSYTYQPSAPPSAPSQPLSSSPPRTSLPSAPPSAPSLAPIPSPVYSSLPQSYTSPRPPAFAQESWCSDTTNNPVQGSWNTSLLYPSQESWYASSLTPNAADLQPEDAEFDGHASEDTSDKNSSGDVLFQHLRSYETAHEAVQQARLAIFNLQQQAKGYASKLWIVQSKSEVVKASCGDGATMSHNYSYQVGHLEPDVAAKLKKTLNRLFKQRTKGLVRMQHVETSCRLWIQDHIATFLNDASWAQNTVVSKVIQEIKNLDANKQDLERTKHYLDVLFRFERSVRRQPDFDVEVEEHNTLAKDAISQPLSSDAGTVETEPEGTVPNSILQSIRDWIAPLAATLLRHGGYTEYEYLTVQVLKSQRVSGWAATFIQCNVPSIWSNAFQEFYLRQLTLVLCGRSRLSFPKESGSSALMPDATQDLGSDLEEDDCLAILDQMDVPLFFHRLLMEHKGMHCNNGTLLQREMSDRTTRRLFAATSQIFTIVLYGLRRRIRFNVISKRTAQMLCQLSQILGDHVLLLGPSVSGLRNGSVDSPILGNRDTLTSVQQEVDRILVDVARALLALPGHGLWTFIPSLPFKFMSSSVAAKLLEEIALDNISQWITDPLALLSINPESNKLRELLGKNPGEAIFLLGAMAAIITSRSPSDATMGQSNLPSIDYNLALVVTFLLLDVAYLDSDIRGELSKPVREILSSVCDSCPTVISLVLRFVEKNFKDMGDMAQYLFRALPLDEWCMSDEDFALLKSFLESPPLNNQQSMFARYIFSSLCWGQMDIVSDGERKEYLSQTHRKELALTFADICAHSSADQTTLRAFMDWCWKTIVDLDLTELPVLTLVESSRLYVPDPSLAKNATISQGQLTFVNTVHLLLTEASRDENIFLQEGWTILSSILHAGMGSAFLDLAGKLIVMVILSGKDLDAHVRHFGQLLCEMAVCKQDAMLATAGAQLAEKHGLLPSKVPKDLLALWYLLQSQIHRCGTERDDGVVMVLRFWTTAIFSQKEWMAHQECVQVMDVVCLCCFELGQDTFIRDVLTEQQILLSIGFRRAPGVSAELMGLAQPGFDKVMDMLPERFQKALPVPQGSNDPSLLIGTWSVKSFATNLLTQQAMVESNSIFFAYYALLIETTLERDMRIKIGNYYHQHPEEHKLHGNIKTVMKTLGVTSRKTLQNFAIWRWAQHLLILPFETYLLPLFWQEFFYLYFGHVEQRDLFYGYKFLETGLGVVEQLRDRLQMTYAYFGQEARKAIQEMDPAKAAPLTALHEFYIALYGWISEPLLLTSEINLKRIRNDLMPDRLITCRLPDPLDCNSDLWKDLLLERTMSMDGATSSSTGSSPLTSRSDNKAPPPAQSKRRDQTPAVRKHSHAWQEQKISNCLIKQSKPGPEYYIPRMLVLPLTLDHKSSPQSLFGQTTRSIRDYCKAYRDTNDAYESLNASYLSELGSLYHNEVKTSRLEIACDTTPNALCKRPAVIELQYEEIVLNEQVKRSIIENRTRARALRLGYIEQGLHLAALELLKTVDSLIRGLSDKEHDSDNAAMRRLSIQSFYYLCKELIEVARGYPPAQMVLTSVVETLGMEIVAKDPAQTEPILDLMETDDFAIALLYQTFYPAALPSEFVRLYQRIATCKDYGLVSKDLLLRQFDVQAWACDPTSATTQGGAHSKQGTEGPSVLDRLAFYEVAFTAMVAQQQLQKQDDRIQEATELSTRERLAIIKSHRELAGTLFLNFLQQDYVEYLRILLDTCGIMCLEPEVLEDFIRILGVEPRLVPALLDGTDDDGPDGLASRNGAKLSTRLGLSDYDLGCLVQFLADYFNDCQEKMPRGNLLDRYSGYAVSIASLMTVVLCDERYLTDWMKSYPENIGHSVSGYEPDVTIGHGDERAFAGARRWRSKFDLVDPNQCRMWRDTLMIFRPWLSCLTDRAEDEVRFQRQQSGASRLLFSFVGIISKMLSALQALFRDTSPILVKVFELWLDLMVQTTLGQGCINQTMLIHQHFQRLEWRGLELSNELVERILEVSSQLNIEIQIEFWTYFVTVIMQKADSDLRPQYLKKETAKGSVEWHQTESVFLKLGLTILQEVDMVVGHDLDTRQQFLDRLWAVIFDAGDWTLLSTDELRTQVEALKVHWDRAGPWDNLSSPMGLLLYWMRIAVGLESTNLSELDSEDGTDDRDNSSGGDSHLSADRVLIYFEYVFRLLQVRLASSAEESQNVNFRMNAIPLVVSHLAQVLDRIAGNRFQTKHPVIYKPLLALVGILNQCGKGPSSLSLSPSGYQSFDAVFRGLVRMISEVEMIQLDVIRVACQRLNSIPVMINLLEEAIEREFDLWTGQQYSAFSRSSPRNATVAISGSSFGLEDTPLQQMVSPMPVLGHNRSLLQRHTGGGRESWSKIKAQIDAPELNEDEFLKQALVQGAILTIYGRFLQRLDECEQSQEFDEVLAVGQELAEVISNVDLSSIEPWKAYQSLLLLRMFLNLVAKESVHSVLQSRFLNAVKQVCRALEPWFQDRDSTKGMLSSIGMGTRSSFDTKFRLVIRIIYTYLVVRLQDKGVSIHHGGSSGHAGGGGGVLAWRKGRQNSGQSLGDSLDRNSSSAESPPAGKGDGKDVSMVLIETLAQLPIKNKDYASIFSAPTSAVSSSSPLAVAIAATTTANTMAMAIPAMASSISMIPALASSPIELVKKTILSSSPPSHSTSFMRRGSSSSTSSPLSSAASTPAYGKERRASQNSGQSINTSSLYNKRLSFQSHHSRFSTGSSWDDTAGSLFLFEGLSEVNGGPSSSSLSALRRGLVATQKRFGDHHQQSGTRMMSEHRSRLQYGTKNGIQDLEWVVQQIQDRRFRILEAAEVLTEVMERFYEGDDYFA